MDAAPATASARSTSSSTARRPAAAASSSSAPSLAESSAAASAQHAAAAAAGKSRPRNKALWRLLLTRTRHFPPLLVAGLILTGYGAFLEGLGVMRMLAPMEAMIQFVVGHFFFLMFTWSWIAAVITNPADLPDHEDHPELHYCTKCHCVKPDRTHHCSWCDKCVQRFDHHCPWVGGCVGQHNHKAFMLFLLWLVLGGMYGGARIGFLVNDPLYADHGANLLFMLCGVLVLVVGPFMAFHAMLVARNLTSLEYITSWTGDKDHLRYYEGVYSNICSVMGDDPLFWLIPILPKPEPDTSRYRPLDEEELNKPWYLQMVDM